MKIKSPSSADNIEKDDINETTEYFLESLEIPPLTM